MRRFVLPFSLALTLLVPAASQAAKVTYGSDLTQRATLVDNHPRDWAAWPTAYASGGGGLTVPVQGEVSMVQLKGIVQRPPSRENWTQYPAFEFHIVVLRPQPNGLNRLVVATSDAPVPYGGDDQQISTINTQDANAKPGQFGYARICVLPGDRVAIATSGGFGNSTSHPDFGGFPQDSTDPSPGASFYDEGYPVQMFGRTPGSSYSVFKQPEGNDTFQIPDEVAGAPMSDRELLMRVTIGTGPDARWTCRTPEQQSTATGEEPSLTNPSSNGTASGHSKAAVIQPTRRPKVRRSAVKVGITCPGPNKCEGLLKLSNNGTSYGSTAFALANGQNTTVDVKLNKSAKKGLRKGRGKVTVKANTLTPAGTSPGVRFVIRR